LLHSPNFATKSIQKANLLASNNDFGKYFRGCYNGTVLSSDLNRILGILVFSEGAFELLQILEAEARVKTREKARVLNYDATICGYQS
jgi:hypothetical protein